MPFVRPSTVPFPIIYSRFTGRKPLPDGTIPKFRIQDVPEDLFDECTDIHNRIFLRDEPMNVAVGFTSCEQSLKITKEYAREMFNDRVSLLCVIDEDVKPGEKLKIVGLNLLEVSCQDKANTFEADNMSDAAALEKVFTGLKLCSETCDVYEKFGVDKYLGASGMVVLEEYRGQNIGLELLKARIPLCRALGLKLTATVFTSEYSKAIAYKAGFQVVGEMTFEELREKYGIVYPGINSGVLKYMVLTAE